MRVAIRWLRQHIPPGYLTILLFIASGLLTFYVARDFNIVARPNDPNVVFFSLTWIAGIVIASIVWRWRTNRPVLWPHYPDAVFSERWCSGSSHRTPLHRISGARNCLMLVVTPDFVRIDTLCPFNLAFFPEILGLAHQFPPSAISSIERAWFGGTTIRFQNEDGWQEAFTIWSRRKEEMLAAFQSLSPRDDS